MNRRVLIRKGLQAAWIAGAGHAVAAPDRGGAVAWSDQARRQWPRFPRLVASAPRLAWQIEQHADGGFRFAEVVEATGEPGQPAVLGRLTLDDRARDQIRSIYAEMVAAGYAPRSSWQTRTTDLGIELWRLLPPWFHDYYWERLDRLRIGSLAICSAERTFPWELVTPEHPGNGKPGPMIGMSFPIARWDRVAPLSDLVHPAVYLAAPRFEALPLAQQAEIGALEARFAGLRLAPGEIGQVLGLLTLEKPWLLHLAAHGSYDQIFMSDGRLLPADIAGSATDAAPRPALAFLNVCDAGQPNWSAPDLYGWTEALRQAGCGAVVAPLWRIAGQVARQAAQVFYDELGAGRTLAEAGLAIRRRGWSEQVDDRLRYHPTWLAYTVHGHPDFRVTFGLPNAEFGARFGVP